jgi:hypothetical protein
VNEDELSKGVVDAAFAVHRALGPGLLESAYAAALQIELANRRLEFEREWPIGASYGGRPTYLRLADLKLGLILNFNNVLMKDGMRRIANGL